MATIAEALALGWRYHEAGDLPRATHVYRQVIAADPGHLDALFLCGAACQVMGRSAEAAACYGEVLALSPGHARALCNLGVVVAAEGRFAEAADFYLRALDADPALPDAHNNLAIALSALGRPGEAEARARRALELRPDYPEAYTNLGNALKDQDRLADAAASYARALELRPEYPEAHNNLGNALAALGRADAAAASYREALRLDPDHAESWENLAALQTGRGEAADSAACYRQALRLRPGSADAHNSLANALRALGETADAVSHYRHALRLDPGSAAVHHNLGCALQTLGETADALDHVRRALALRPDDPEALVSLGNVYEELDRPEDAGRAFLAALAARPDFAEAYNNLGNLHKSQGRLDEAVGSYRRALAARPGYAHARMNLGIARLLAGDLADGWADYESRWRTGACPPAETPLPRWDGSPLGGRAILLHAEQGLGDTLQFVRYARLVGAAGGEVVLECPPALRAVLAGCAGVDRLVSRGEPRPGCSCEAPLMSLPGLFGTTLATVPAAVPYLKADPERVGRWARELAGRPGLRVGLVWRGNPRNPGDRRRSLSPSSLAPLAGVEGVRLVSLQTGPDGGGVGAGGLFDPADDLGPRLDDFAETAAVLAGLDLLVSCDTAAAHLAGALGVPVWVLLPFDPDWRWLLGREDSPWYPSARLFRQARPGDWPGVVARVVAALRDEAARGGFRGEVA